jgi:hypothetical protein
MPASRAALFQSVDDLGEAVRRAAFQSAATIAA